MNSLSCHAYMAPNVTNRALGPTIGPDLQFTKSSGYNSGEEERLKAEQSMTTDLPVQALTIDMREGMLASSSAVIKSPFGEAPAVHFKRTAHALATLEPPQAKSEQAATLGCLPVFISKISMGFKKEPAPLCATAPRRQLLPPPKTVILPSDPHALRQILEELQAKRDQAMKQARTTSRLAALPPAKVESGSLSSLLAAQWHSLMHLDFRTAIKRLSVVLGDLIDKLAVA